MSEVTSFNSFPNDPTSSYFSSSTPSSSDEVLSPAFESSDFYDPFSDLSLFLSKKIKGELQKTGSSKKWSGKIESHLLAKILPEFKQKFPNYRLGVAALRKVWEKVSHYYEKIQNQTGALQENGTLDLHFMIRENLKEKGGENPPLNLPPYHFAHQVALKVGECMATFEGVRPDTIHLFKLIWSAQKHLLRGLSSQNAKSPYEDFDPLDKLIVKTQLEVSSEEKGLSYEKLIKKTRERLFDLQKVEHIAKRGLLSSTLSLLLAKRLSLTSFSSLHFALSEKKWVEAFIECQIELSTNNHFLQKEESQMERVQRILSLFPIARELPSELEEKELKRAIQIILSLLKGEDKGAHLSISSPLFVFINAQLHIISESKGGSDRKELEEKVIYAYKVASTLPYLSPIAWDHLEMLVWKRLEEKENLLRKVPEEEREVVDKEIGNILIENPHQTFHGMILTALQLFKKIAQFDLKKKEKELERKSELWAVQGEMLCKSIHFDEKNPLLLLIQKEWETWSSNRAFFHHREFIHYILECAMKKYTILEAYPKELKIRIWILYKYFWYQLLKKPEESTYERFLSYHTHNLKTKHPSWKKEEIERALEEISKATLPLIPTPAHAMCNFK